MKQQRVDQRAAGVSGGRMHDEPGRLVEHDEVGVLEQHGERDVLGLDLDRLGRRDGDGKRVVRAHALAGLGDRRAVELDMAVVDQPLHRGARQLGDDRGDQRVDALAGAIGLDGEAMLCGNRGLAAGIVGIVDIVDIGEAIDVAGPCHHSPSMPYWRSFFHSVVRLIRRRAAALVF